MRTLDREAIATHIPLEQPGAGIGKSSLVYSCDFCALTSFVSTLMYVCAEDGVVLCSETEDYSGLNVVAFPLRALPQDCHGGAFSCLQYLGIASIIPRSCQTF